MFAFRNEVSTSVGYKKILLNFEISFKNILSDKHNQFCISSLSILGSKTVEEGRKQNSRRVQTNQQGDKSLIGRELLSQSGYIHKLKMCEFQLVYLKFVRNFMSC